MRDDRINAFARPGDGAVDAFVRQKQRAGDVFVFAQFEQRGAERLVVFKAGEVIKSADCIHGVPITPKIVSDQDLALGPIDAPCRSSYP